ncbi:MAG: addiction module protein [Desulfococcaceae bacterium]
MFNSENRLGLWENILKGSPGSLAGNTFFGRVRPMSDELKKVEEAALRLTESERAFLADRLLGSLGKQPGLSEVDAAWLAEAERRYQEYKEGKRPGVPVEAVFEEADRLLK